MWIRASRLKKKNSLEATSFTPLMNILIRTDLKFVSWLLEKLNLYPGFFLSCFLFLFWFIFAWLCLSLLVRIKLWHQPNTHTLTKYVQYSQGSCWCCIKERVCNVICFSAGLVMKRTETPVKVCVAALIQTLSVTSLFYRLFRSSPIRRPSTLSIFCNMCLGVPWDYIMCAFSITMAARCWWGPVTIDGERWAPSWTSLSRGATNTNTLFYLHLWQNKIV